MAKIISDIRDVVTSAATGAIQSASDTLTKRKIALITGITGQVIIIIYNN
jgi:flavin-binding protein dodecin